MSRLAWLALMMMPGGVLAQPTVDGVVDGVYGAAVATDPAGDGNGKDVMDLRELFLFSNATDIFLALTIKGDIVSTSWGKYLIYIDTTNDTSGASSDAWGRNVTALDPHKPEYSINTWVDQTPYSASHVELWQWTSGSWSKSATGVAAAGLSGGSQGSIIEIKIPRSALGNPQKIWVEAWSTGNGTSDNAQDTVNDPADDWNATDWATQSQLKVSTEYSLAPQQSTDAGPGPDSAPPDQGVPDGTAPAADTRTAQDHGPAADTHAALDQSPSEDAQPSDQGPASDASQGDASSTDAQAAATDAGADAAPKTSAKQDEGCACSVGSAPGGGAMVLLLLGLLRLGSRQADRGLK
jgi:MYXO-CTERM domain-containing protein